MADAFIGRQPIYDRNLNIYAYELLYRSGDVSDASVIDGDQATSTVVMNAFLDIGLENLIGPNKAFINFTRWFLTNQDKLNLPPSQVVIEVLEDVAPDPGVLSGIQELARRGFTIALDDFVYDESLRPLTELADIIKIEVQNVAQKELMQRVRQLRKFGVKILAEKVETYEQFQFCRKLGLEFFQGYFFSKPKVIRRQSIPPNQLATLQLLEKLQNPEANVNELANIIETDVALSYKLMRYINSAFLSLPKKIESLRHAVVYLGLGHVRSMATLISLSAMQNKPLAVLSLALTRAKMCEYLAHSEQKDMKDIGFTVGLFSALDVMLDMHMEQVLENLPLSDDLNEALVHHSGNAGNLLACVLAYEHADWPAVEASGYSREKVTRAYLEAIRWADGASQEIATRH